MSPSSPIPPAVVLFVGLLFGCAGPCPMVGDFPKPEHAVYITDSDFPVQFMVPDTVHVHYQGCKDCSGGKMAFWFVSEESCWNASPDFGLNMKRNDTISARAYRTWAMAEEQYSCDPSTLDIWKKYDCMYTTIEECRSGNSWYRLARFSFSENPTGKATKYYSGYKVTIFKNGLVVDGAIKYVCSEPMDVRPKEEWMLSWLRSIRILSDVEWESLKLHSNK